MFLSLSCINLYYSFSLFFLAAREMARMNEPPAYAPRILYISPDKRVDEGTPIKLTAQVQATPAPKVVWWVAFKKTCYFVWGQLYVLKEEGGFCY